MRWGGSFISSSTRAVNGAIFSAKANVGRTRQGLKGRAAVLPPIDRPFRAWSSIGSVTQGYALGWYGVAPLGLGAVACFER
jgi:hypothetical protein